MTTGLNHLHTNFANLLVLFALIGLILSVVGASKKPSFAAIMTKNHKFGILMLGRLVYVAGLGLAMAAGFSFGQPWMLAGLLLWGVVEVAGKRLVAPELDKVLNGETGSGRLIAGAAIQLLVIAVVWGVMHMKPSF